MTIGGFSSLQGERMEQRLAPAKKTEELVIAVAPAAGSCICTQAASTLISAGGTDLAGRKTLIITNPSPVDTLIVGPQSSAEIYLHGFRIEPGCSLIISFAGDSVPIYGRTDGGSVEVEVFEC